MGLTLCALRAKCRKNFLSICYTCAVCARNKKDFVSIYAGGFRFLRKGAKKKDKEGTHAPPLADNRAQRREGAKKEGRKAGRSTIYYWHG